jgi:hypothetical protein
MDDMFVPPKKSVRQHSGKKPLGNSSKPLDTPPEPIFTPPEVVAEREEAIEKKTSPKALAPPKPPKKASWWKRLPKKKKLLLIIPTGVLLLSSGGVAAYFITKKDPPLVVQKTPEPVVQKVEEPPKPTTVASKLTGVQIDPELNKRGVTAVMIENSMDARPQSGLLEAGIIHEAIAEGGITRFVALFQEAQPGYIGPVRSARPYYIDWILPYSPAYAHAGGSPEALQMIAALGMKDMEHGVNGSSYQRVSNRYAPHNLYTSMANLDAIRTKRGWENSDFTGFLRKADSPSKTPNATSVDFKISSVLYNVHYDYDAATNSYLRSEGGKPHTDEKSGKQLNPKVVIALIVPYSIHPDGIHSKYATIGTGQAYIYQDGTVQEASWTKSAQNTQIDFKDTGGRPISFNAGQTWITALGQAGLMTYTAPAVAGQ